MNSKEFIALSINKKEEKINTIIETNFNELTEIVLSNIKDFECISPSY